MGILGTGFGVEPTKDGSGNITSGTSSKDMRWIISGMYNQGILRDCFITTSTSGLTYTIGPGSVVNSIGPAEPRAEHVMMPVYGGNITTTAGGASARTDYIYVKQNLTTVEGNSDIVYGVTSVKPSTYDQRLVIATFDVPANMTKTSQATMQVERNYATPISIGGKYLVAKHDPFNDLMKNRELNDLGATFSLHTARLIRCDFTVTIDSDVGAGVNEALQSMVYVNGTKMATFSTGRIDQSWTQTISNSFLLTLPAGRHNITLKRDTTLSDKLSSKLRFRYNNAGGYPGQTFHVTDCGVLD